MDEKQREDHGSSSEIPNPHCAPCDQKGTCPLELDATCNQLRADSDRNTFEIEEINARSEDTLRNRALTFSVIVTMLLVCAHIWFSYIGKTLAMPDIVWAIVLAPWFGAGGNKIVEIVTRIIEKK